MTITLTEIPGLDPAVQTVWKVRALVIGDRNPVQAALERWAEDHPNAHKAILKVMRLAAQQQRVKKEEHVKRTSKPRKHGDVYEMRAHTDIARLFFFYEEGSESLIICTNDYDKGNRDQDAAFQRCADLRDFYRKYKNEKQPAPRRPAR